MFDKFPQNVPSKIVILFIFCRIIPRNFIRFFYNYKLTVYFAYKTQCWSIYLIKTIKTTRLHWYTWYYVAFISISVCGNLCQRLCMWTHYFFIICLMLNVEYCWLPQPLYNSQRSMCLIFLFRQIRLFWMDTGWKLMHLFLNIVQHIVIYLHKLIWELPEHIKKNSITYPHSVLFASYFAIYFQLCI